MNKTYLKIIRKKNCLFSTLGSFFFALKKCLFLAALICVSFALTAQAETQKERIERMQKAVVVKDNGDVFIPWDRKLVPDFDFSDIDYLNTSIYMPIMFYIAPDMDYEKLFKALGKSGAKKEDDIPPFLGKYLRNELKSNIKYVEETRFNAEKIRKLIDKGTIIAISIGKLNKEGEDIIVKRARARADLDTKEEFEENLKNNLVDLRKLSDKNGLHHWHILNRYNKFTKEFCLQGPHHLNIFLYAEEEISKLRLVMRYYEILP